MSAILGSVILLYLMGIVLALAVIYVIKNLIGKIRIFILGNKLPGPKGWPLVGNALELLKKDSDILDKIWNHNKKYGLMRLWIGSQLNVFICTAEDAETYYLSPALYDRSEHFDFIKYFIGNGLLTANGSHWKKSKRLMEPSFRYSSLRSFVPFLNEKADILVSLLEKEVGKRVFSVYDYIKNCTFDIITRVMCDMELNAQIQYVKILEDADVLMAYITSRMYSVTQQSDFIYKYSKIGKDFFRRAASVKEFVGEIIAIKKESLKKERETLQERNDEDLKRMPFLQRLIVQEEWNDEEIKEHLTTMIATGYETMACEICFALVLLGIHQDVQKKLHQEISSALDNSFHDKDLAKLEYLDKVIKESMRIFPIAPILFRKAGEDVHFGKHLVPKGAAIAINIFAIHRDTKYYDNPSIFNPENFSKEKVDGRHPFAFIPFGAGIRKCIGEKFAWMALRTIITKILLKYKIECDMKLEDIKTRLDITLKMTNGFPIRLLKR